MTRVLEAHEGLGRREEHFGSMQSGVRAVASAWLLAGLGSAGYVAAAAPEAALSASGVARQVYVSLALLLTSVGLLLLWVLDQVVYQGFLNAVFILKLFLEYREQEVPPVSTVIALNARKGGGIRPWVQIFYVVPVACLALLSLLAQLNHGLREGADPAGSVLALAGLSLLGIVPLISHRVSNRPIDRLDDFGDKDFAKYVRGLGSRPSTATVVLRRYLS